MSKIKKISGLRLGATSESGDLHITVGRELAEQLNWHEHDLLTCQVVDGNLEFSRSTDQRGKLNVVIEQEPKDI